MVESLGSNLKNVFVALQWRIWPSNGYPLRALKWTAIKHGTRPPLMKTVNFPNWEVKGDCTPFGCGTIMSFTGSSARGLARVPPARQRWSRWWDLLIYRTILMQRNALKMCLCCDRMSTFRASLCGSERNNGVFMALQLKRHKIGGMNLEEEWALPFCCSLQKNMRFTRFMAEWDGIWIISERMHCHAKITTINHHHHNDDSVGRRRQRVAVNRNRCRKTGGKTEMRQHHQEARDKEQRLRVLLSPKVHPHPLNIAINIPWSHRMRWRGMFQLNRPLWVQWVYHLDLQDMSTLNRHL